MGNVSKLIQLLASVLVCLLLIAFNFSCRSRSQSDANSQPYPLREVESRPGAQAKPPLATGHPEIGFRARRNLDEHYDKHGAEFDGLSREQYLKAAQDLRDAPAGGDILEARRPDGTVSRFDRKSGAFLAYDSDLTIRTFFKPNDGERYFRRQINREH